MFVPSPHITPCYDPLASKHKTNLGLRRDEERLENEERFEPEQSLPMAF